MQVITQMNESNRQQGDSNRRQMVTGLFFIILGAVLILIVVISLIFCPGAPLDDLNFFLPPESVTEVGVITHCHYQENRI